jgi:hypothetical protein
MRPDPPLHAYRYQGIIQHELRKQPPRTTRSGALGHCRTTRNDPRRGPAWTVHPGPTVATTIEQELPALHAAIMPDVRPRDNA